MFHVLLIGSGGREYAFLRKLLESLDVKVTVAPGLSGMLYFLNEEQRSRVNLQSKVKATDIGALVQLATEIMPDLVVIGPEDPLIMGLADELQAAGFKVFGLTQYIAKLTEGSKWECKQIYKSYNFPTADAQIVEDPETGKSRLKNFKRSGQPIVLKCDEPALGKGVIVIPMDDPNYWEKLENYLEQMFDPQKPLGFQARRVLLESQFPVLCEWSAMSIVGANHFWLGMMPTKDHKLLFGKNTGGMGIVTPAPGFSIKDMHTRREKIDHIQAFFSTDYGREMRGIFYEGLNRMLGNEDYLVEVNCRGGDPETQGQLEFIEGAPLHEILLAAVEGRSEILQRVKVPENKVLVGVVMASKGYPGSYEKGKLISVPEKLPAPGIIFPSGLVLEDNKLYTAGGRVLMPVGEGETVSEARDHAYEIVKSIKHDGVLVCREDIGIAA